MASRRERRYGEAGKRRAGGQPFRRRHRKLLIALFTLLIVVPIVGGASYAYMLNSKLNNVAKLPGNKDTDRPDPDKGKSLNILLLGSDKGKKIASQPSGSSIGEDAKADEWPVGKYRSDTLMIVHISANRKHVYLTSIPRDTFATIYDAEGRPQHQGKINAAFSEFGPLGAISTVEHLTNLRMEHLAIIDWAGFRELSSAVGGVPVTIPKAFYDPKQKIQWEAGPQVLEGKMALAYVRTRYGLLRGDFDRIARQQNFLRALMKKILDKGTMTNPVKLINTVSALTKNLTVDAEWSAGDMRGLALSLRGTEAKDVRFLTAPIAGTETVPIYGSIVRLDEQKAMQLWDALRKDSVSAYIRANPDDVLPAPEEVR